MLRSSMYNSALRNEKKEIVTRDGSRTLYSYEFDEAYHSTKDGAFHESLSKHVIPALSFRKEKKELKILDICFGLGYNTFTTLYYIKKHKLPIQAHILSPELDESLIRSLDTFTYPKEFDFLAPIIKRLSQDFYYEDEQFKIQILLGDARKLIPKIDHSIDIVYQDAFSPTKNPLLWTREYFADIRHIVAKDAILTTYSTALVTRLGLFENGFNIFLYKAKMARRSIVASPSMLEAEDISYVDMELKKEQNPTAHSLRDEEWC